VARPAATEEAPDIVLLETKPTYGEGLLHSDHLPPEVMLYPGLVDRGGVRFLAIPHVLRKEGRGKARAETDRVHSEAHKLFDEISNMLTEMRRELLGGRHR
jgi:hypothetical protein